MWFNGKNKYAESLDENLHLLIKLLNPEKIFLIDNLTALLLPVVPDENTILANLSLVFIGKSNNSLLNLVLIFYLNQTNNILHLLLLELSS